MSKRSSFKLVITILMISIMIFIPSFSASASFTHEFLPGPNYTQTDIQVTLHTFNYSGAPYPVRVDWIDPSGATANYCKTGGCGVSYDQEVADNGSLVWRNFYFYISEQQRTAGTYTAIAYYYQDYIYKELFRQSFYISGTPPPPPNPRRCYVNAAATGGANNGGNWANAYTNLQSALGASSCTEVWVKSGTYKPATADRSATFQLKNGVALYGGFAGTETTRDQRNPTVNVTILSGDLNGDDVGFTNNAENVYHVVTGATGAIIDGFTIKAGNANSGKHSNGSSDPQYIDSGGGMYNRLSSPTLTNVIFSGNKAYSWGGGMINFGSSPIMEHVIFSSNSAGFGGGMLNNSSNPILTDVTFSGNIADFDGYRSVGSLGGSGGGMENRSSSSPTLTNVTFISNQAACYGGCYGYGGGMENDSSSPTLTNVTFKGNSAYEGGGMDNYSSNPQIRNTIFWGNTADVGAQIYDNSSGPSVSYSVVQGGYAGGTNIITADPLLGTLGKYGGFTQTIPLLAGSSAIDTGNDAVCPPVDQRSVKRPQNKHCDIGAYELDGVPPTVSSITRTGSNPTSQPFAHYSVTFSETVTGVGVADFKITKTGITGTPAVTAVTGSGRVYDVTISTGAGSGTLRLDIPVTAVIQDLYGNLLTSLPYVTGPVYTLDRTVPTVSSITLLDPNPNTAARLRYRVTFSENVKGVDATDFVLTASGLSGVSIASVTGSGRVYDVSANSGSGFGTLRLDVRDNDTIRDALGNRLGGTGLGNGNYTAGPKYTLVRKIITFTSLPLVDGWVLESTESSDVGGSAVANTVLQVGDDAANKQYRSLLYFNTSGLPDNANIVRVTLKILSAGVVGTDPFGTHGSLLADIRKGYFGTASNLQALDFQADPSAAAIGKFVALSGAPGWYQLTLSAAQYAYINKAGPTQFRLRFQLDENNDRGVDLIKFYSGEAPAANRPTLVVEYKIP